MLKRGLLFCLSFTAALTAAEKDKSLARVAILTYEDETGTKNFGYMPNSLTEAIDKSLQKKFEYVREEPKKSEAARKAIKPRGALDAREAAAYCLKNDVQILVFGQFNYDAVRKQIIVDTFISLGSEDKFRRLKVRTNPTDASIFVLAEKVADDIVAEMTLVAKEQQKGSGGRVAKANEKLELKKETTVAWSPKLYTATLAFGVAGALGDLKSAYDNAGTLMLSANRLLWRGFYAGLMTQYFRLSTKEGSGSTFSSSLTVIPLLATAGYSFFFWSDRWRLNAEFGAGYYGAKFAVDASSTVIYTRTFYNPALRGAVSLHWLIFNPLAIGLEVNYLSLLDQNQTSGKIGGLALSASYVF